MLIIICGLPGSGKTTLAKAIAKRQRGVLLSSDAVRKRMFAEPRYSEAEKNSVYEEMAVLSKKVISDGKNAVVDATFGKKNNRAKFQEIAGKAGTGIRFIMCTLAEKEVKRRLDKRGDGSLSDADFEVYLKLKASFEPLEGSFLVIDSMMPLKERLALCEKFIGGTDG